MAEKINTRRSFTKEVKLKVVQFFYNHDINCNQTPTYFKLNRKQVRILFIEISTLSFYLFYCCHTKFFVHVAFHALHSDFLLNPSNSNLLLITVT